MSEKKFNSKENGWSDLVKKEDWWAVWIGLILVVAAVILWSLGSSIKFITAKIPKWTDIGVLFSALGNNIWSIVLLFVVFLILFSIANLFLHYRFKDFFIGFLLLFILSVIINSFSSWGWAQKYNLEAPLVALFIGLIISNLFSIPKWFETALRTELYVKVGIVLLGATLPFTLIVKAGPVAFLQATVIAVSTFLIIYFVGTKWLGLDKRFAATLGAGGSICGVSASIAVGSAIQTKKEHVSVAISLVVAWAVVMIFALSIFIKVTGISAGAAGAWIGTSEFADAAGVTAASSFGDKAITTFTLMKVVGRDMFIGIWCFILAIISITKWEDKETGVKANASDIWHRFPKFVIGFFAGSIFLTILLSSVSPAAAVTVNSNVIAPIKEIRTWAFTFCFLSIGLTTRFKQLTAVGWKPFAAFSTGAVINVILGYLVSVVILGSYWSSL